MIGELSDSSEVADSNLDDYEAELQERGEVQLDWDASKKARPARAATHRNDAVEESPSKIVSTPTRPDGPVSNVIPLPKKPK